MGRNKGTNNYSNSFEPQVKGPLDARDKIEGPASDLVLESTWTSSDGNVWAYKSMVVSVANDPDASKNGLYMLMADDYTVASNWMKIGASGGDEPIYLTTPALLDATADIPLNASDIVQLRRLFDKNDTIPNVKYIGVDEGGTTYSHVEMNVSFTTIDEPIIAMFIHPFGGDGMVMQLFVNTGTASAPMAMGYMDSGGGSGSSNVKVLTTPDLINPSRTANITLNAADVQTIKTFTNNDILVSASTPAGAANTQTISIPLTMNKIATGTMGVIMFSWVYGGTIYNMILNISNGVITAQKPQAVTGSGGSADSKPDLAIDVKTGCKNGVSTIYYRIREVVPNGYIQFVRKKKTTYRTPTVDYKQSRYSVKDLSVHSISGVAASTLQPNVWYEFPISKDDLVSTYAKGSLNPGGVARAYDMFKFNGNTHARPIEYSNMGTAPKATTVLHAGLQYNVLEDTFVNGTSANPIFKQRGEVIPIDVRLTVVDTSVFASGFKLIFAVQ